MRSRCVAKLLLRHDLRFSMRSTGIFDGLASLGLSISEEQGEVLL